MLRSLLELELTLYGSTVSGFALTDSDVNMTITEYESPTVLRSLCDVLKADESGKIISCALLYIGVTMKALFHDGDHVMF